jgi:hypothetical protein
MAVGDHGRRERAKRGTKPFRGKIIGKGKGSGGLVWIPGNGRRIRESTRNDHGSESVIASGQVQEEIKGPRESELQQEERRESSELQLSHPAQPLAATKFLSGALIALAAFLALAPAATSSPEPGNPLE